MATNVRTMRRWTNKPTNDRTNKQTNVPVVAVDVRHVHPVTSDKCVAIKKDINTRWEWDEVAAQQKAHDFTVAEGCQRMHRTVYYLQQTTFQIRYIFYGIGYK